MPLRLTFKKLPAVAVLCAACWLGLSLPAWAIDFKQPSSMPGADLFDDGRVCQLTIQVDDTGIASLRTSPREFVRASVTEGDLSYGNVGVRLKGSVGSFQELDQKPALTLDFGCFGATKKFHGLRRVRLNNSVEDPSYCNELLGSELFRAAGVPAPRVAHAVVTLNGRRLGLFVLKEGATEDFLACFFRQIGGNLYEPGEGHDVNQHLKRNSIAAPHQDRAALEDLARAALETNAAIRWNALENTLDVREFVNFMALEVMLDHRDGYAMARNNYRVYFDLDSSRFVFLPEGMDQLFGNPNATWRPSLAGLVARAVMDTPQGNALYREQFGLLLTNVFHAPALQARVDRAVSGLRPVLNDREFADVSRAAGLLKERIDRRQISLQAQLREPIRPCLAFSNGVAAVAAWVKTDASDAAGLDLRQEDGEPALHIAAHSDSGASWRAEARLPRGHYRFAARAKVAGVAALPFGRRQGAGVRVIGQNSKLNGLTGDSAWRDLSAEFDVKDDAADVELICELRAARGDAWFDLNSLRVCQLF